MADESNIQMKYVIVFQCILCHTLYDEYTVTASDKSLSLAFAKALSSAAIRQHTCIRSQDMLSEKEPTVYGAAIFAGIMTEDEWNKENALPMAEETKTLFGFPIVVTDDAPVGEIVLRSKS